MEVVQPQAQTPVSGIAGEPALGAADRERAGFGDFLGEVSRETDYQIALSHDTLGELDATAQRGISAETAQARAEHDLLDLQARNAIDSEIQDSQGINRALQDKALRTLTAQTLAAKGTAHLAGIIQEAPTVPPLPPPASSFKVGTATATGGGFQLRPTCQVHLIDESVRGAYRQLCRIDQRLILVCPQPAVFSGTPPEMLHLFPNWWSAELACRLINDCRYTLEQVRPHFGEIEQVILFSNQPGVPMKPLCQTAQAVFHMGIPGAPPVAPLSPGEILPLCSILPPQDIGVVPCVNQPGG